MLHLTQTQRLQQKLTPAQVQYLKILQLPVLALEQRIKDELELNPLLEEGMDQEEVQDDSMDMELEDVKLDTEIDAETPVTAEAAAEKQTETSEIEKIENFDERDEFASKDDEYSWEEFLDDNEGPTTRNWYDEEDDREIPTPASVSMIEQLTDQVHMLDLDARLTLLAEEILGNIDEDGYLHRDLEDLVLDVNHEHALAITKEEAEFVLGKIQRLDPAGIGARNLRECLLVQAEVSTEHSTARIYAQLILRDCYDHLVKKHFEKIKQELHIDDKLLRKAFDFITHLNPKPGEGNITTTLNYVIPDFFIVREKDDFVITLNDRGVPPLRVSRAYREMLSNRRSGINPEARQFLRQKMESAKWFIQSINQRRQTMLGVMQTIVEKQRDWFEQGPGFLKPLIYRDIADVIGMDISTISRVVNGKYAQTEWGVFELRRFFSEGIPTATGGEVSNTEVKSIIRDIIAAEEEKKPLSDEAIMQILRERGFDIARRTVAKYREALGIPVSRLRVKL